MMMFYPGWYLKHRIDLMRQYPHEIAPLNQGKLILGKLAFRWNDFLPTGHPSLYSPPRNEALHLVGSVALALTVSVYWVIYQVWDAAFHHWEKSWKYNVHRSNLTNLKVFHLVIKHCVGSVKWLILFLKQNEFRRRN